MHSIDLFGLKYLMHLDNLGEKNTSHLFIFFIFFAKQKINLTWPKSGVAYKFQNRLVMSLIMVNV